MNAHFFIFLVLAEYNFINPLSSWNWFSWQRSPKFSLISSFEEYIPFLSLQFWFSSSWLLNFEALQVSILGSFSFYSILFLDWSHLCSRLKLLFVLWWLPNLNTVQMFSELPTCISSCLFDIICSCCKVTSYSVCPVLSWWSLPQSDNPGPVNVTIIYPVV